MRGPAGTLEIPKEVLQEVAQRVGFESGAQVALHLGEAAEREGYLVRYTFDPAGSYQIHRYATLRSFLNVSKKRVLPKLHHTLSGRSRLF